MSDIRNAANKLPSEPAYALLFFADEVFKSISRNQSSISDDDALFAIRFIEKFKKKFEINCTLQAAPPGPARDRIVHLINQIRNQRTILGASAVDSSIDDILDGYAAKQEETFGLAKLNSEEKTKIAAHLAKVRKIVEESKLADRKKNALFDKINDLQREVDTHGTRTDRFFAFAGDVGFVLGDMAEKAKPLITEVKEILKIVSRSRARQEGISLPAGDEVLQLPSPDVKASE